MSNTVARVLLVEGQVMARAPDGALRVLTPGSEVGADDIVLTAKGARVQLDAGSGELLDIAGGREIRLAPEPSVQDPTGVAVLVPVDARVRQALTVLQQGGDVLDTLEETAAGNSPAEGGGEGHSVFLVDRVVNRFGTRSFEFAPLASPAGASGIDGEGSPNSSPYVNRAPNVVDQILVGDEDVAITGVVPARDVEDDVLSFAVSKTPSHGDLVLDSSTGRWTFVSDTDFHGSDSFSVTVTDSRGNESVSTTTVNVRSVNDLPTSGDVTLVVNEDGIGIGKIVATDVDGDTLTYAVTGAAANGTVVLNPTTGSFTYKPNADYHGSDSFVVTISDGQGGTTNSLVTVGVSPFNDLPVSSTLDLSTEEDTQVNGKIVATDVDGDTLTYAVTGAAANGTVVLNPTTGSFTYKPNADYHGSDSFVVTISDGQGGTTNSLVTVGVSPSNDLPVSSTLDLSTEEDTQVNGKIVATDVDGDTLTYAVTGAAANGTVVLNPTTGSFTYKPNADYHGSDSFVVTISDGQGGTTTSVVKLTVLSVNDRPLAPNQNLRTDEDTSISGVIDGIDADGDRISYSLINAPNHGVLTLDISSGRFNYTPNSGYVGTDIFRVQLSDGQGGTSLSEVVIVVDALNSAPVAVDDVATVAEGSSVMIAVRANDQDPDNDALTVTGITQGTNGSVVVDAVTGNPVYTPYAGFTGLDSFTYTVRDGNGGEDTATVAIKVEVPAAPPITADITASGSEDTLITVALAGRDADGSVVAYVIQSLPAHGVLYRDTSMTDVLRSGDLAAGAVYFKPDANWNGRSSFVYAARDNDGLTDATSAQAIIQVDPAPDDAVVGSAAGTVTEDTPGQTSTAGTLSITDPDAGQEGFEVQSNTPGIYGDFSITSEGDWTYIIRNGAMAVQQLKAGEQKTEVFTVKSIDGTNSSVSITVTGSNDGPVASADAGTTLRNDSLSFTPAELLGNDADLDGDTLSIDSVQGAENGSVALVAGNVIFVPSNGYHGPASFTYTVIDGQGGSSTAKVDIVVVKPNTAPDAGNDSAVPATGAATGFHAEYHGFNEATEGANLTRIEQVYSYINNRAPDATFTAKTLDYGAAFTSGSNLGTGSNLQTFLGSDASSLSNDPATTSDAILRIRGFVELGAGTYNFRVFADDGYQILVDGIVVAQSLAVGTTTHPEFTLSASGLHHVEVLYWDQGGRARLEVLLSDDAGVTYDLLSAAPNYSSLAIAAVEDTPLAIAAATLLANDVDADGDGLAISSVSGAVNGTVSLVAGNIVFTPALNYSGPASFTYTVVDGKGGNASATVNLSVSPLNDAPVPGADSGNTGMNTMWTIPVATLLANDTDSEGNALSIVSVQDASNGAVSLSGNNVRFTPTTNYEGAASFTYTLRDPAGASSTATVNLTVGSATAPSVVVSKALLALAQGTGGTSVKFPVISRLVDTDGSESLSIKISGVPTGLSFNAGTNLGGGVWLFASPDLPNLVLNLPGSYTTLATNLTVQVISTEMHGGGTASTSSVVTLKAAYTSVDSTTTASGNYTGSSANEDIWGGEGNNTINANSGNNLVNGGGGDDTLSAAAGSDMFFGGGGNDTINAGSGSDRLSGGVGNDLLKGGDAGENFVDVFVWSLGDQGGRGAPAVDTIQNFATAAAGTNSNGGDVLDLRDLLQGEHVGPNNAAGNLADYLHFEISGADTQIRVSHNGGFAGDSHTVGTGYTGSAETQTIVLSGVNLQTLYAGATTDQQLITQLLNNNKLLVDP